MVYAASLAIIHRRARRLDCLIHLFLIQLLLFPNIIVVRWWEVANSLVLLTRLSCTLVENDTIQLDRITYGDVTAIASDSINGPVMSNTDTGHSQIAEALNLSAGAQTAAII